jgi:membrane fusion protein, adhesin transport system
MSTSHSDFAFANDVRAAAELRVPRTSRMLLLATSAMLLTALVWAHFAVLDEVKRGDGRVVPSQQIQVVQSLEGGIVEAILVREGAIVQKGELLVRINDTNFASQLGEVRERRGAMAARVARLEAEAQGRDTLTFSDELISRAPNAVAAEANVFQAHKLKLAQDIEVLIQQKTQHQRELDEYGASETKLSEGLALFNREANLTRNLFQQKVVPEIEMIRVDRQIADMRGQLEVVKVSKSKASAAIQESESRMTGARAAFRAQADDDLAKSKGDLAVLDENIKSAQDKVSRAELRAPVYGIVNKLNVTTVGAVMQPAASLMEIVPLDDTLLVEGRIRPQDIAFIRQDQDAVVKFSAYDSNVYGSLKGKVERISADTISEEKPTREKNEMFYRVMVRTDRNHLGTTDHPLPIIPGMVATVEVLTGQKTVLDYLIKPARMLRDEALREK